MSRKVIDRLLRWLQRSGSALAAIVGLVDRRHAAESRVSGDLPEQARFEQAARSVIDSCLQACSDQPVTSLTIALRDPPPGIRRVISIISKSDGD
ncbi:MAG: hypothetical protein GY835_00980 [bacterium]|nr:hypothetical protein [bacterium]